MSEDHYNEMMFDLEQDTDYRNWCDDRTEATVREVGSMNDQEFLEVFGPIPEAPSEFPVFVYGSLKRGFSNHDLLSGSKFCGSFNTVDDCFRMNSFGSFPAVNTVPDDDEDGYSIYGELYMVDPGTLRQLDQLEGNGSFYTRSLVRVNHPSIQEAWIYLMPRTISGSFFSLLTTDRWVHTDNETGVQEWVQR